MFSSYMWNSASIDADLLTVTVYRRTGDTESQHFMTMPKSVRQVRTRHFTENVETNRFQMQQHGSLLRVELTVTPMNIVCMSYQ